MYTQSPNSKKEESQITMRQLEQSLERAFAVNNKILIVSVKEIVEDAIDELALSIGENFNAIDNRFKKIDERFDKIDERFEKIDERFEKIDERFEKIDEKFDIIDRRFDQIDLKLEGMDSRIIGTNNRIDDIATNFTRRDEYSKLEKRVGKLEVARV